MKCTVFLDGEFLVRDDIFLEAMTPGIFEGRGVFETMRVENGHLCFLERHIARLKQGLKVLNIRLPYTIKELQSVIHRVLMFNQLKNARLRLMAYQRNRSFSLAVIALPRKVLSDRDYSCGYSVTTTSFLNRTQKYACVKSLDYGRYRAAYQKAVKEGFQEVFLINPKGYVFEASRSNVFFVKDGIVHTPSLTLGCLEGITRRIAIECAREHKIVVKTVKPKLQDFLASDEVFLTNALLGIMPITKIGAKTIQLGRIGDVTYQLRNWYLKKSAAPAAVLTHLSACV
jgi:branched-subunit amino acid aminotransferase/4-amino-4-deoxychorismate lyase